MAIVVPRAAFAQAKKPNILVIWGDDIGLANVSAYSDGVMGFETPNIDRIGKEGIRFLQYYGEQSCTAGRSAFLTGQHIIRSGLSKVGFPGAPMGMSQLDPSVGGLLRISDTPPDSSVRTTLAIAMKRCLRSTASTNSLATFITSTPRRNLSCPIIRRTRNT